MAKCPNCSGENADTQRFCGECGTPLTPATPGPSADGPNTETIRLPTVDLPTGSLFAKRYQVIEELGTGGMGRVYRAVDTKLGEEIALKVIRPEIATDRRTIEGFASELKLARQVVHKNVARMFDLNEEDRVPYITMEYVRGENLRRLLRKVGRLFAGQAIPIVSQVCEGLAAAHGLGIVHRDLKPQNVMVDEDGQAKIMDFGLARQLRPGERAEAGGTTGTPAYVSPEQIQGRPPDARSDIYSLGVMMFELLTGAVPFKGSTAADLIAKHLHEPPPDPRAVNPGISVELGRLVLKCLEKEPARRPQTAEEVRQALDALRQEAPPGSVPAPEPPKRRRPRSRRLAAAGLGAVLVAAAAILLFLLPPDSWKPSLAVLPVEEVTPEKILQNLCVALQDEITDRLSGIAGLRVLPSRTVNSHDLRGRAYPEIRKLLGVRDLLRLTLAVEDGTVRIKLYLLTGRQDTSPAPLTYSKDLGSYRLLQDEISRYIARTLGVELAEEKLKKIRRRGTDDIEAYSLYLDGTRLIEEEYSSAYQEEDFQEAVRRLQRAVDLDPRYALAYWALGGAYEIRYYDPKRAKDPGDLEKMFQCFEKASQLDPDFGETNLGLGWYYFNKGNNARAFDCFKKALALDPQNYKVNIEAGAFLRSIGLYRQAMPFLERAARIAPHVAGPLIQMSQCWLYSGRFDKAVSLARRAASFAPGDAEACSMHALALVLAGRLDDGAREIAALKSIDAGYPRLGLIEALLAAARGETDKALALTAGKPVLTPPGTYLFILLGRREEAVANIEAGIARGLPETGMYLYSYPSLVKNPGLKSLRGLPRFQDVLRTQKDRYLKELEKFEGL